MTPERPPRGRRLRKGLAAALAVLALLAALALAVSSLAPGPGPGEGGDAARQAASEGKGASGQGGALPAADDAQAGAVPTGPMPSVFASCEATGGPESYASGPLGVRATWQVDAGLPELAQEVLQAYEGQGLSLRYSGYLDLLGNVWACVVSGDSWVELAVVRDGGEGGSHVGSHSQDGPCLVSVMRLGQGAVPQDAGQGQGEGAG